MFRCNCFRSALLDDFVNRWSLNTWRQHHQVLDCCHSILCAYWKSFKILFVAFALETGPWALGTGNLHRIIEWIAGYNGTTMQIGWENKWIRCDEFHQRNRFRLIWFQSLNQWALEAVGKITIQINIGRISTSNIPCLRFTFSFLWSNEIRHMCNIRQQLI